MSRTGTKAQPALDSRASIRALAAVVEQVDDLVCVCNPGSEIEYVNPAFERHTGYTAAEVIGKSPRILKSGRHDAAFYQRLWATILRGEPFSEVFLNLKKSGELYYEAKTISVMRDRRGRVIRYVSTGKDVTERMLAEQRFQRLSRARAVIAECTHVLVHASDEIAMLHEMCRILVERGGHRSVWIGFAEQDERKTVRPVASAGIAMSYAADLRLTWADELRGRGAVGAAIRTRRPKAIDDYFAQPEYAFLRDFALKHGFRSALALPLLVDEDCTGVLTINAPEPGRFDAEEVRLLEELAGDIAFGIRSLRARQRREQAEQALRESEERFRATFEQAALGVAHVALDGRLLRGNQKLCDMVGYTREELLRLSLRDITHPDDIDANVALREEALAGRRSAYAMEKRYVRKDGSTVWGSLTVSLIRDPTGRPEYFVAVVEDITARKRAEREIERQHKLLREVIDAIPSMIFLRDAESRYVLCNRTLAEFFGKTVDWIIGKRNDDFIVPSDERVVPARTDRELFETGAPVGPYEISHLRDGQRHWFQYEKRLLTASEDGQRLALGVGTDVTQRKRAEDQLLQFRLAMDASSDSIYLTDAVSMRFVDVNTAACGRLGYTREQLLERYPHEVLGANREQIRRQYEEVIAAGEQGTRTESHYLTSDGGGGWTELTRRAVRLNDRCIIVTIGRDISDRKRAEQALRESEEQLRQLASNVPEAFWIEETGSTRVLYVSPGFVRITGWRAESCADAELFKDIVCAEDSKRVLLAANDAPRGGFDEQYRVVRPDGSLRWVHSRTFPIKDATGAVYRLAGVMRDITEQKAAEDRLTQVALYDVLTSLPNRNLFYRSVQQGIERARSAGKSVAVLFLDLDRFKNVNDTLGHAVGDDLLREVAGRLVSSVRARDTLGRLGGDEFAVLLPNLERTDDAAIVAQKILKALAEPFVLEGQEVFITASIGITTFPADGEDPDLLLRAADTAMYQAKGGGRNRYRFYTAEMNERALERLQLESMLRRALERNEFLLHYQPKVRASDSQLCGAEALLRWKRPDKGLVSPVEFIPLLEDTGMIVPVGEWVIAETCRQIRAWRDAGLAPVQVAINLSGRQFLQRDLPDTIQRAMQEARIEPGLLEFEITEGTLMSHAEETIEILEQLRKSGIGLSVDDFGTGYSSLGYLKRFPIDALKIDRSFIRDATRDADDAAIVKAIIRMAHELDLKVVAEGVETQAQLEFLRKRGCDEIQGYLFSKPLDPDAFAGLLSVSIA